MRINIGDKFVAVKKLWFINEGTEITVTNVDSDGIVSFTFGENGISNGYMDSATFVEHFEKIAMEDEEAVFEITDEYIAEIMENSEFDIHTVFNKCTVVSCRLPNGFVITESSSCVDPKNYDEDTAAEICFEKIADKIAELEAYRLQQWMWENDIYGTCEGNCECSCDGNCAECAYGEEVDECLDTDLDCDDCEDFDCPYNSNIKH